MRHKFLQTCLASVLIFVLLGSALEGLARSSFAKDTLLPPSYGGEYLSFDRQLAYLEDHPEVDCIFVGSSMTRTMINPAVVAEAYQTTTGNSLDCFNLSINGMPLAVIVALSEFVQSRYEPQWLLIEISHQAFFQRKVNEFDALVLTNDWIAYLEGDFNTQGWLLEHSAVYRYLQTYKNWASPQYSTTLATFRDEETRFDDQGFYGATIPNANVRLAVSPKISIWERNFISSHRRWDSQQVDWDSFEQALTSHGKTRIILLEMPVHESYMTLYPNGREDWQSFITIIKQYADEAQVPFWVTNDKISFADEFWHSRNHLLWGGATQLSDWVGTQLGLAEQQEFPLGDVPDPTLRLRPIEDFVTTPFALPAERVADYQSFVSDFPDDASILHLSDEDPRYFAYDIGRYIGINGREPEDFQLLWLLEHAQVSTETQTASRFRASANYDYVLVTDSWLKDQPQRWQDELQNPARYTLIARYNHRALALDYLIYRVLESESP